MLGTRSRRKPPILSFRLDHFDFSPLDRGHELCVVGVGLVGVLAGEIAQGSGSFLKGV